MTVKDLINKLQTYNPELPILGSVSLETGRSFSYGIGEVSVKYFEDFTFENMTTDEEESLGEGVVISIDGEETGWE